MANEHDTNVTQKLRPGSHIQLQETDFAVSVKRLRRLAYNAARTLFTNSYLQRSPSVATELVTEVHALAAILNSFEDEVLLASAQGNGDQKDMWTRDHHRNLTRSIRECDHALVEVDRAVRTAEEQSRASLRVESRQNRVEGLCLHNGSQLLDTIVECFHLVAQTKVIARYSALSRVESLNDDETQEKSRLLRALQHPNLQAIWTHKNTPSASKLVELFPLPSYTASASSVEPSEAKLSTASGTPESSSKPEDKFPEENILPVWAYNQWPPFGNYQHPAYLAAMAERQDKNQSSVETPSLTTYGLKSNRIPASNPSIEPLPASNPASTVARGNTKPEGVLFGEPSVNKPISSGFFSPQVSPSSGFATYSQPKANPFAPTAHLEAYILRPTVQTTELTSTLSYKDEPLRLGEETLQSQIRGLGAEHSIMDVLLDLHPQQLNLIQRRAAQRYGQIVSVQHGRPVSVDTVMGSLLAKSAVYIISTTTVLAQESTANPFSTLLTEKPANPAGTFGSGRSVFEAKPPFTPGFGTSNYYPSARSGSHLASPEAYSRYLQERGEVCTHVEGTECKGQYQHYQTITANKDWHGKDLSLEEIRLADYQAGRKGSGCQVKTNSGSYPAVKSALPSLKGLSDTLPTVSLGSAATLCPPEADPPKAKTSTTIEPASVIGFDSKASVTSPFTPGTSNEISSADLKKRVAAFASYSSSWGYPESNLQSSILPKPAQSSASDLEPSTTRQLSSEGYVKISPDATSVPRNPLSTMYSTGYHPGFGPLVGAADPSDQSKWITHPQRFCEIQHQHGLFCRVSPAEAFKKTGTPGRFPTPEPLVSSGFGKFTGTSSKSPFATFTSKPLVLGNSAPPKSSQTQSNSLLGNGAGSQLFSSPAVNQVSKDDHTGSSPPSSSHPPCDLFGCQTCRPTPGPIYNKFDWGSAGPQSKSPSWSIQPKSVLSGEHTTPKPGLSGAAAASQAPFILSGFSTSKPGHSYADKVPTEQGPSSVGVTHTTSEPAVPFSGAGLFGQGAKAPSPVPLPRASQPTATPAGFGLFGVGTFKSLFTDPTGQTSATKATSSSQSSCQVPTQTNNTTQATGGAIYTATDTRPPVSAGSFGMGIAATASTPTIFDQPKNSVQSASTTPNLHSYGLDQPVKATAVAPGTLWSGHTSNASSSIRLSPLQDYRRQLKELEKREAELKRAETVAKRGPHDDAALAELLDSKKTAPVQGKGNASSENDRPERAGAASPVEVSYAAKRAATLGSEKPAIMDEMKDSSLKEKR